jgi:hypothetical protein
VGLLERCQYISGYDRSLLIPLPLEIGDDLPLLNDVALALSDMSLGLSQVSLDG